MVGHGIHIGSVVQENENLFHALAVASGTHQWRHARTITSFRVCAIHQQQFKGLRIIHQVNLGPEEITAEILTIKSQLKSAMGSKFLPFISVGAVFQQQFGNILQKTIC